MPGQKVADRHLVQALLVKDKRLAAEMLLIRQELARVNVGQEDREERSTMSRG